MTTRIDPALKPSPKHPINHRAWEDLLRSALHRAEQTKDARSNILRRALTQGTAERTLRSMGIISSIDLSREFPAI